MTFHIALTVPRATAADAYTPWNLAAWQRARCGAVEPSKALWIAIATDEAADAGLDPEDVVEGYKGRKAAAARWRAWKRLLDGGYKAKSIARITGWSFTDIRYGLRRLAGAEASDIRKRRVVHS